MSSKAFWKPISNILSASSNTNVVRLSRFRLALRRCSSTRPGVPTIMCAPCSKEPTCGPKAMPPHKESTLILWIPRASLRISTATWSANSRVGHSTRVCTRKRFTSSLFNNPKANVAVLPEPVLALAITSLFAKISGKACAWIGVISV